MLDYALVDQAFKVNGWVLKNPAFTKACLESTCAAIAAGNIFSYLEFKIEKIPSSFRLSNLEGYVTTNYLEVVAAFLIKTCIKEPDLTPFLIPVSVEVVVQADSFIINPAVMLPKGSRIVF